MVHPARCTLVLYCLFKSQVITAEAHGRKGERAATVVILRVTQPYLLNLEMKKNTIFFSIYKSFRDNLITTPMVSLGNLFELPELVKKLGWRLLSASFPKLTKFNGRLRQLSNFVQHILKVKKNHGDVFVVKYLKASQLAISKAIAGNPFRTLSELEPDLMLPRLATCGLPGVIPLADRRAILSGSPSVIR